MASVSPLEALSITILLLPELATQMFGSFNARGAGLFPTSKTAMALGVGAEVGVSVGVGVEVGVVAGVDVGVGVNVGICVGVGVSVGVSVGVGVCVGVSVGVSIGVRVGDAVSVGVAVRDGVGVDSDSSLPQAANIGAINIKDNIKSVNLCLKQFCRSIERPPDTTIYI